MTGLKRIPRLNNFWHVIFVLFSFTGIVLAINQLFSLRLFGINLIDNAYLYMILCLCLSSAFLLFPARPSISGNKIPWYDVLLFLLTAGASMYLAIHGLDIIELGWEYTSPLIPTICSVLLWVLVLEAVRRCTDIYMVLVCLFFGVYPLFAVYMPGFLQGQSYDFLTTARLLCHGPERHSSEFPLDVVCTLLIGFMVFGIVLQGTGGGGFLLQTGPVAPGAIPAAGRPRSASWPAAFLA